MNPRTATPEAGNPELAHARQVTLVVYILHGITSLTLVTFIVAVAINYAQRERVAGTIYDSHFEWQISTFWFTLLYFVLGVILCIWGAVGWLGHDGRGGGFGAFSFGILVLVVNWIWHLYRVIRGLMHWSDRRPM